MVTSKHARPSSKQLGDPSHVTRRRPRAVESWHRAPDLVMPFGGNGRSIPLDRIGKVLGLRRHDQCSGGSDDITKCLQDGGSPTSDPSERGSYGCHTQAPRVDKECA